MYQTLSWSSGILSHHHNTPTPAPPTTTPNYTTIKYIERVTQESAVVIFSISTCCMCHAIKRLFCGMGVHPTVYELDHLGVNYKDMENTLVHLSGVSAVPVVFIGGKLVGSMDRVMASHINGSLVPMLKNAGALWL